MPIRRRSDGEIIDEKTEVVATTRGAKGGGRRIEDSLFKPGEPGGQQENHLDDPTVAIARKPRDDDKTRLVAPRKAGDAGPPDTGDPMSDPPVGWLVVVRGPGKGRVLTVGVGMNVLGRGADARIRVDFGDDTIARVNHARLAYEPRERRFLLDHGDGSNLTYLNGEVVMQAADVVSGANIELGNTTLRFQALCGKEFDWPDLDD